MKYLIIFLFPILTYSQNFVDIINIKGGTVDFAFSTRNTEYATDLAPFVVVIEKDKAIVRRETIGDFEKATVCDFMVDLESGTYQIKIFTTSFNLLAKSKYFTIGHIK